MSVSDEDKPTVVLDLNELKKQKLKQEEDLESIVQDLEFAVGPSEKVGSVKPAGSRSATVSDIPKAKTPAPKSSSFPVILFDYQSDFFEKTQAQFPKGFDYQIAKTLNDLNKLLSAKSFQIVVFNYDVNAKAVNQLTAQIKQKFPTTKTLIMAKVISPEKAKSHAQTASGASGYYQFPLDTKKIEAEFLKIQENVKKAS